MLKKNCLRCLFIVVSAVVFARGASETPVIQSDILLILPEKNAYDVQILLESLRVRALAQDMSFAIVFQEENEISALLTDALKQFKAKCIVLMVDAPAEIENLGELEKRIDLPIIFTGTKPEALLENSVFIGAAQERTAILTKHILETYTVNNGIYLKHNSDQIQTDPEEEIPEEDPPGEAETEQTELPFTSDASNSTENVNDVLNPLPLAELSLDQDGGIYETAQALDAAVSSSQLPPDLLIADTSSLALKAANYLQQNSLNETILLFSLSSTPDVLQFVADKKITASVYVDYKEIAQEIFNVIELYISGEEMTASVSVSPLLVNIDSVAGILENLRIYENQ